MPAEKPEMRGRAAAIYTQAGYRCCTLTEFTVWYVGAQEVAVVGANSLNPRHDPGSAAAFCLECHPLAQQEMASQGRCVRLDMGDPEARERMRRWRARRKERLAVSAGT